MDRISESSISPPYAFHCNGKHKKQVDLNMRCKCKNNIDGISSTWVSTYLISDDKIYVPLELTVRYPEGGRGAKPSSRARTSTRHVELTIARQSTAAARHLPVVTIILYWYVVVVLPLVPGMVDSARVSFAGKYGAKGGGRSYCDSLEWMGIETERLASHWPATGNLRMRVLYE